METKESIEMPEFEKKDNFTKRSFSKRSGAWDREKIRAVIEKLKEEDDGSVKELPISWIWVNLRTSQSPIKYVGYYSREVLIDTAEAIGISLEAHESGCEHFNVEKGVVQVQFKEVAA